MKLITMTVDDCLWLVRSVRRFRRTGTVMLAVILCPLSACSSTYRPVVNFGEYVSRLCEAIGPFEHDEQKLGRVLGRYGVDATSHKHEETMVNRLSAVITDSRRVVVSMDATGIPRMDHGRQLAAAVIATFDEIEQSDLAWRSELRRGPWAWSATSRAKQARLRTSLEALLLVGYQIEHLPMTQERQDAMARSPVCRTVFGSTLVD